MKWGLFSNAPSYLNEKVTSDSEQDGCRQELRVYIFFLTSAFLVGLGGRGEVKEEGPVAFLPFVTLGSHLEWSGSLLLPACLQARWPLCSPEAADPSACGEGRWPTLRPFSNCCYLSEMFGGTSFH